MTTYTEYEAKKLGDLIINLRSDIKELKDGYQPIMAILVKNQSLWGNLCRYGYFDKFPVYINPIMDDEYSILTK